MANGGVRELGGGEGEWINMDGALEVLTKALEELVDEIVEDRKS